MNCYANYEDGIKAIQSCPNSFFVNYGGGVISKEDAIDAIYAPMKTSYVKSDNPITRVYNKKGFKLALTIDNSPAFKLALKEFTKISNPSWLIEDLRD